ncbi:hypothetical protein M413DRAFT_8313 [Hebeloma cylindrosporum]|uniref:Crinkler effector protein N-terminal domain-containing protein n=1 Tax=Hebeloma cylindrosporum TaxID=76867 RepID=A0A0C2Y9G2_HEBCY|nr:hypothetical protein M413DRAFT_8313 [Hebeloma cylindrosporum h7]
MPTFHLLCAIHNQPNAVFEVDIDPERTVAHLKQYIIDQHKLTFAQFEPWHLKLWKWNKLTPHEVGDLNSNDSLNPIYTIGSVFEGDTLQGQCIHILIKVPGFNPSSSDKSIISNALKRGHSSSRPDRAKRLKIEDTLGLDSVLEGLNLLWQDAWGKGSATNLFQIHKIDRDGTLPHIDTPETCTVLNLPPMLLRNYEISAIMIRREYLIALEFVILIAQGGEPSQSKHRHELPPNLSPAGDPYLNPFPLYSSSPSRPRAVTLIGHPGIGKTLFLLYVLVCRMLASLPSICMEENDTAYIINSSGVKKVNVTALNSTLITDDSWCLVDSNDRLPEVPKAITALRKFIIQTTSPHAERTDWWTKFPRRVYRFFMREWDLQELIAARSVQTGEEASELNLKTFLDRFIAAARQAFIYGSAQDMYARLIMETLEDLSGDQTLEIIHSGRLLDLDKKVSHHLVLITPSADTRLEHLTDIPTRFLYETIRDYTRKDALQGALLLHEIFKEVTETTFAIDYIYEDFARYLIPRGGQRSVITMEKFLPKRNSLPQDPDTFFCVGCDGGPPFHFSRLSSCTKHTPGKLKITGFYMDEPLVLENGFYYPHVKDKDQAMFDGFLYDETIRTAAVLQVMTRDKHFVPDAGFAWLKSLGVEKVYVVGITPVGKSLDLRFNPEWDSLVKAVYHLPLDPEK